MTLQLSGTAGVSAVQSGAKYNGLEGEIRWFARSTAPNGFLKANGDLVSRTEYAALFQAIGTTFGVGNGSTTFNLPDLRGEFPRGWDDGRGIDAARAFGSAQLDQMQGHFHTADQVGPAANGIGANTFVNQRLPAANTSGPVSDGTNGTPRTGAETRPRNIALLACISI